MKYLTDVDGVLLMWINEFSRYMKDVHNIHFDSDSQLDYDLGKSLGCTEEQAIGYVMEFNRTAWIGYLGPYRDSVKYLRKMYEEHGVRWTVISALGPYKKPTRLRIENLKKVFGDIFDEIYITPSANEKFPILAKYAEDDDCVWVEDHTDNAEMGFNLGMNTFLMTAPYNIKDTPSDGITRVNTWKEIYEELF